MRVVDVRDFDIPSDENDYDELVAFADTMASIEQFDAYTKDEVIDMLTELQTEIEEKASVEGDWIFAEGERFCGKLIQEKIEQLKDQSI